MADETPKQCFVLSPIGDENTPIRERADRFLLFVKSSLMPVFEVRRGDDEVLTGTVIHQIIADIARADLIVVNLEAHNPNVMYELGIAKDVIGAIVGHGGEDEKSARVLIRHYLKSDLIERKRRALEIWDAHLNSIISGQIPVDNVIPIRA